MDILHVRDEKGKLVMTSSSLLQEALQGPSDLMVCFGTFHRLHNINNSINAKLVTQNKSKRSLIGKESD